METIVDDSSDRSSSISTTSQDYQFRNVEGYEIVKRLKISVGERDMTRDEQNTTVQKSKDFRVTVHQQSSLQYDEVNGNAKTKNFGLASQDYHVQTDACRMKEPGMKETFLNWARDTRQKYLSGNFERTGKDLNYLVERDRMKEFNLTPLDRMRDSQIVGLPSRERISGVGILEGTDLRSHHHHHVQPRSPQDLETIAYERMRRSHHLLNQMDFAAQNLVGTQLPTIRTSGGSHGNQLEQLPPQRQIKSFTIDAILAHRNNQRERHQKSQQQISRKAARQECTLFFHLSPWFINRCHVSTVLEFGRTKYSLVFIGFPVIV